MRAAREPSGSVCQGSRDNSTATGAGRDSASEADGERPPLLPAAACAGIGRPAKIVGLHVAAPRLVDSAGNAIDSAGAAARVISRGAANFATAGRFSAGNRVDGRVGQRHAR